MKWMKPLLVGLLALGVAIALLVLRPWSEYNVLKMNSLFAADERVENMRNMDRIFPSRPIFAPEQTFTFDRDEQPLDLNYRFGGENRNLDDFLERVVGTGFLVIQDDKIIDERYMNGSNEASRFTSWSVAKSFVATLVGMMLGDGRIESLDDPVTKYVSDLRGTAYDGVPIKHILQMSSGVDFDETYGNRTSDINLLFIKVFGLNARVEGVAMQHGRAEPSGERFHYVSIDTQILALLLRSVSGLPLATMIETRIWEPLGMEGDAFWSIDQDTPDGVELAFCCLNATLRDYAKLGRLYLNDGVWDGQRLLPEGWVQEATTPGATHLTPEGANKGGIRGYQYQWWVPKNQQRDYFASGVWGQYIYVSEPDDLIVVRTSVDPNFNPHMEETITVFRAIRDALRARNQ